MKPVAFLLAIGFFGSAAEAATNLVVNGSFEQGSAGIGSFQGWQTLLGDAATFVDSNGRNGLGYGQASDGLWSAYFGSSAASGGAIISQTLSTVVGQTYTLSFDIANDNAGLAAKNRLTASIDGSTLLNRVDIGNQGYTTFSTSFVASGTSNRLGIAGFNDTGYLEIDNVSVSAVPEPGTVALLMAGILGLYVLPPGRKRR